MNIKIEYHGENSLTEIIDTAIKIKDVIKSTFKSKCSDLIESEVSLNGDNIDIDSDLTAIIDKYTSAFRYGHFPNFYDRYNQNININIKLVESCDFNKHQEMINLREQLRTEIKSLLSQLREKDINFQSWIDLGYLHSYSGNTTDI